MVSEEARSLKLEVHTPKMSKCVFKIKHNNIEVFTLETKQKISTLSLQFSHSCSFLILPLKQFSIIKLKGIQVIV